MRSPSDYVLKMFKVICIALIHVAGALCALLGPCKIADNDCLTKSSSRVIPLVYAGIPSMGIPSSDPILHKVIEVNFPDLKFKMTDVAARGFMNCNVKNSTMDLDKLKLNFELECPKLSIKGNYEVSGKFLGQIVEGVGTFDVITGRYLITVNSNLKYINKNDGKTYLNFKNYKIKPVALEPIKMNFRNLFNNHKELSDAFHTFTHENWKILTEMFGEPIFRPNMNVVIRNSNKFLATQPLEEIFVDFELE